MNIIEIHNLHKHYKILNRREGLLGSMKDLVSRNYRYVKAVNDISITVKKGEIIGFLGPNGAGKSTTIKMMTGVLEPTSGSISVNGLSPYKNRVKYVRDIGVVLGQRSQLWWELPVIESFKLIREIYRVDKSIYEENMELFNNLVQIENLHSIPARFLSLGQRMLCDIAASFLHNPSVIFLDEPTIGLDVSIKEKIRTIIKELNKRKGVTIILTTHDISDIEALCKRIVIIDKGIIIYDGEIQRVNKIFGALRYLKLDIQDMNSGTVEKLTEILNSKFQLSTLKINQDSEGWINITINQDELALMELLSYITGKFPVKDIKIQEIETENIIKRIYEGGLI